MRLPNSYGNVSKLPGKRRNPWRVRKTSGWVLDEKSGTVKQQFINIGYYPTKAAALQALADYNANPNIVNTSITFAEVYEKWSERKFPEISNSSINLYSVSFKHCQSLHHMNIQDIKLVHLQQVIDEQSNKSHSTKNSIRTLMNQLFDWAVAHDVINKNNHIVEYVNIGKKGVSDRHYRFTPNEVNILWQNTDKEYATVILMMIYSGARPGELLGLKRINVNLKDNYFTIEKGKTVNAARKVPIHKRVMPFWEYWYNKNTEYLITDAKKEKMRFDTNHQRYKELYWEPILNSLGILKYTNESGIEALHVPHDTRHTFTSMWKDAKLDEGMRRKIQGHSGQGIGEQIYTHYEFKNLCNELNKL